MSDKKVGPLTAEDEAYIRRNYKVLGWGSNTVRGLLASLDAERERAAQIAKDRDHALRKVEALLDQIEAEGCAVAHLGERTYECNIQKSCGLCRLRDQRDELQSKFEWAGKELDRLWQGIMPDAHPCGHIQTVVNVTLAKFEELRTEHDALAAQAATLRLAAQTMHDWCDDVRKDTVHPCDFMRPGYEPGDTIFRKLGEALALTRKPLR